jgi:creatinine amidohydrolase/Fe(II)-dependent formamide hydrolase-like protein
MQGSHPFALDRLTWSEVEKHQQADSRLLLPLGTCDPHGPHLPLGASTRIAEALADDLSREFHVLRAPTFNYGVNLPAEEDFAGATELREKTLHRALNDLVGAWEEAGFTEFILITAHLHEPHVEALASVGAREARIRVLEPMRIDLSGLLGEPVRPQHAGEVETSLLLHLHPELVRSDELHDHPVEPERPFLARRPRLGRLPRGSAAVAGRPSRASAEVGARIYAHLLDKIRQRVFLEEAEE